MWSYFLSCTLAASTTTRARIYIHQYICTYTFATRMTTLRTLRPGGSRLSGTCVQRCSWWVPAIRGRIIFFVIWTHFLACEDVAAGSQQSGGKRFFHEIQWPVRWVPAVRWRNHYFTRNKEALPCCGCGPSCQPLHVQSMSDGSRSLTTLTMLRREHHDGGRWRCQDPDSMSH